MSKQFAETNASASLQRTSGSTYSARIQEAMRYNKLRSADYPLAMAILNALTQGHTQEQWEEAQQRTVKKLTSQQPDTNRPHADAANRYEQTVRGLQDMMLWPW